MTGELDRLLTRLEELFAAVDTFDDATRGMVIELLDGVDTIHRLAIQRWAAALGADAVERTRHADPAVTWLLQAYGVASPVREVPVTLRRTPPREGPPYPPTERRAR